MINHASLFTGIGGFDYAAEQVGWNNVFQVENNGWCQNLLTRRFPDTDKYYDINLFDAKKYKGTIDVLSGGFPCQPSSHAGKREGKDDDRYLWDEMLRVIRECQPGFVVGENVAGLLTMDDGKLIDEIFDSLEGENYKWEAFVIPACAVGAPHRRDRIWIVAYSNSKRLEGCKRWSKNGPLEANKFSSFYGEWDRLPKPTIRRGDDGFSQRMDRLKGLGNAIVPDIAIELFRNIDLIIKNNNGGLNT